MDGPVPRERLVEMAAQVPQEQQVPQVLQEPPAGMAETGELVPLERWALMVKMVKPVRQAEMEEQEPQDRME